MFRIQDQWYELIVPNQRLLDFLPDPAHVSVKTGMLALREVLWSEWGPRNSCVERLPARQAGQERANSRRLCLACDVYSTIPSIPHPTQWLLVSKTAIPIACDEPR